MNWRGRLSACLALLTLGLTACGHGTLSDRVLVVYASNAPNSEAVARYYAKARHIPSSHLCAIRLRDPDAVLLSDPDYQRNVRKPIAKCLDGAGKEKILYIVLAYVRPFRIDPGGIHDYALDSYLADIWDYYSLQPFNPLPGIPHPYYANNRAKDNIYEPFISLADFRVKDDLAVIYSVWRLDGPTPDIARSLVDKAMRAEANHGPVGQACIDEVMDPYAEPDQGPRAGDWDLRRAAEFLMAAGFKVVEDNAGTEFGTPPSPMCPNTALYAGWYRYGHYNDAFAWNEGAIGFHLDSGSMEDARVGDSWSVEALKRGITVTSGAMEEPYLIGLPRPSGVFHDLLAGANVGDAFLRNTRFLKWMIINIGDPLYTPFAGGRRVGKAGK